MDTIVVCVVCTGVLRWGLSGLLAVSRARLPQRPAFWGNLAYIVRHKRFVFLAGVRLGIPWLALIHDWSKFTPKEFSAYSQFFYGPKATRDQTRFDTAWLFHIHDNRHHPQFWQLREDNGQMKCLEMPERYRKELLADWIGANLATKNADPVSVWYLKHRTHMRFAAQTRLWIEAHLEEADHIRQALLPH